jgi:general stress protein 26
MTTTANPSIHCHTDTVGARVAVDPDDERHLERTLRAIRRRSFAVLSTVSDAGFPHAAGVAYDTVGTTIYVNTHRASRKARNVAANPRVALVVPVRRLPVGPPFNVQFQGRAEVLTMDDPEISEHLGAGRLSKITGHGELEEPDGCFLRIRPTGTLHTYGLGVSALAVARDPLHVGPRSVALPPGER